VLNVKDGTWKPSQVLQSYAKKALKAHAATNCITEVLILDAERWAKASDLKGPLAGVPVSLKDSCAVIGYDSTIGFSGNAFKPMTRDAPLIRLLKDAGAIPFVKTAIPITLMCKNFWGIEKASIL
jgi:Asp-tRNA(Asn)/Glu-tRNA(Gln) amidotransferase A subunit family amidase